LKDLAKSGLGPLVTLLLFVITLPILSRLYSPSDFAIWMYGSGLIFFAVSISTLRFDIAFLTEENASLINSLFWANVFISTFVLSVILICLYFFSRFIPILGEIRHTDTYSFFLLWLIFATHTFIWTLWNQRGSNFLVISLVSTISVLVAVSIQIYGGFAQSGGAYWLFLGSLIGKLLEGIFLMCWGLRKQYRPAKPKLSMVDFLANLHRHKRCFYFSLPYTLVNFFKERSTIFILGFFADIRIVGIYAQSLRICNAPAGILGAIIRPVLLNKALKEGIRVLETPVNNLLWLIIFLSSPILALLAHLPPEFFGVLFGAEWENIGPYIFWLSVPAAIFSISNWLDRLIELKKKHQWNFVLQVITLLSSLAALTSSLVYGAPILVALMFQSIILSMNYCFHIYFFYRIVKFKSKVLLSMLLLAGAIYSVCDFLLDRIL